MAVEQIANALPPPELCDVCCSVNVGLFTNDKLYGTIQGEWPYVFICIDCGAAVGCHPNTNIPLGRMADKQTRQLRRTVHVAFDKLWQSGLITRQRAYQWLADELNIAVDCCHISWLSKEELKKAEQLSNQYFNERSHLTERRKAKRHAKISKQRNFERERIRARKAGY